MLTMTEVRLADARHGDVDGRPCDPSEIARQIGRMNFLAISGGKCFTVSNPAGEEIGLLLPCGSARAVEITLDWDDTYSVRRVRLVTKGDRAGSVIVETEVSSVYCDEVGEVAYQASCWK